MRDFSVSVIPSAQKLRFVLNNFNQQALDAIHYRLVWGGNRLRNRIINSMRRTPKTGKKYKRGKKWHIASAPGNAPAVDTGQLLRSIVMDDHRDAVEIGVKSGAPYAKMLEQGTKNKKILPRPFLAPAAKAEIPRIQERIIWDLNRMKI